MWRRRLIFEHLFQSTAYVFNTNFNWQLRHLVMLFICINFPRLAGKDVTSRDSFLEIVAQASHNQIRLFFTPARMIVNLVINYVFNLSIPVISSSQQSATIMTAV